MGVLHATFTQKLMGSSGGEPTSERCWSLSRHTPVQSGLSFPPGWGRFLWPLAVGVALCRIVGLIKLSSLTGFGSIPRRSCSALQARRSYRSCQSLKLAASSGLKGHRSRPDGALAATSITTAAATGSPTSSSI